MARKTKEPRPAGGLPSKDDILHFVRSAAGKVGKREIARAFSVKGGDRTSLKRLLAEMAGADLTGSTVTGANFNKADVTSAKLVRLVGADQARNLDKAKNLDRAIRN